MSATPLPFVKDVTAEHIKYSEAQCLQVWFLPEHLVFTGKQVTALGLVVKLLSELTPEQLLMPLVGSEFGIHGTVLAGVTLHDVDHVEIL